MTPARKRVRPRAVAVLVLATLLVPAELQAQRRLPREGQRATARSATSFNAATPQRFDSSTAATLHATHPEPVVATGAPRTFVVVAVPVPIEMAAAAEVAYTIEATGAVTIVGRRTGRIDAAAGDRALVTVGIPAGARAGRVAAAFVTFTTALGQSVRVALDVVVTAVHRIGIAPVGELHTVRAGGRLDLRYRIHNDGNTADTIRVTLAVPEGWRVRPLEGDASLVLDAGVAEERAVRLFVPGGSSTGDFFVRLDAEASAARSSATAVIEVTDRRLGGIPAGPTLRAAVAAVAGGGATATTALSLAVNGLLSPSIHADGRLVMQTGDDAVATRGFARVNSFITPAYLTVWSEDWRASAGSTAAAFSELTGVNGWGTGIGASVTRGAHTFGGLAARPEAASPMGDAGGLYGISWGAAFGPLSLTTAATHMRDGAAFTRQLSALGVGAHIADLPVGTVSGEVAYRDFGAGRGLGWSLGLRRGEAHDRIQFDYLHAPGGGAAFARAHDELSGTFSRRLTPRWSMGGAFVVAADSNAALAAMRSHSIALVQQVRVRAAVMLGLQARSTSFAAQAGGTAPTAFGSIEHRLTGSVAVRRGSLDYSGELGLESITRTADFEGVASDLRGLRGVWRGTAQLTTPNGVAQLETAYERSTASSRFLPDQLTLAVRAIRVRVSALPRDVFFDAEAVYQTWGVARSAAVIQRAGITMPLGRGLEMSAHAEHNTFFDTGPATLPVAFSLKLERSASLPRLRLSTASGHVFQDHNGNGVRDPGEAGVGNVVVWRGDARAVTGRDGRYEFWDRTRGATTVDASSLPHGWILGPAPVSAGDRTDVALVSTASLVVVLALVTDGGRTPRVDLARLIVIARDERGREWLARRSATDVATFDALPAGVYTLDFDFSALAEPLRTEAPISVRVSGASSQNIRVPLHGRAIRFYRPDTRGGSVEARPRGQPSCTA